MRRRYEISNENYERISDLLPGKPGDSGCTARDNRLFVNAVLWIARTGASWRDLPERFGNWNLVFRRFDRWAEKGIWDGGSRLNEGARNRKTQLKSPTTLSGDR